MLSKEMFRRDIPATKRAWTTSSVRGESSMSFRMKSKNTSFRVSKSSDASASKLCGSARGSNLVPWIASTETKFCPFFVSSETEHFRQARSPLPSCGHL